MSAGQESPSISDLAAQYREISSPAGFERALADKIEAKESRRNFWIPASLGFAVTAALVVLVALPGDNRTNQQEPILLSGLPNLSTISGIKIEKPASVPISMVKVRNVTAPAMPKKPVRIPKLKTQTTTQQDAGLFRQKENHHV